MERQTVLFPTFRLRRRQIHEREMAGIDVLCSNKTGTLSKNQLTLGDPVLFGAGERFDQIGEGYLAIAISHELDHLDGILYTDKMIEDVTDELLEGEL